MEQVINDDEERERSLNINGLCSWSNHITWKKTEITGGVQEDSSMQKFSDGFQGES